MPTYRHIKRLTPAQAKKEVKRLLDSGYTPKEIRDIVGVKAVQTVYNWADGKGTAPLALKAIEARGI